MPTPFPITGLVITFNEADRIRRCIDSLRPLCQQIVVVDSNSTDDTRAIARDAGAQVIRQPWLGFSGQRNFAIEQCSQPWILFLDADEWVSPRLDACLRARFDGLDREAYDIPFRTRFLGEELRFGVTGREHHVRLFKSHLRYRETKVHEGLNVRKRDVGHLDGHILHETARNLGHYQGKLIRYAELSASQRLDRGAMSSLLIAQLVTCYFWIKNYLLRGGFLDGAAGFLYHRLHAEYVFGKYARLWEAGLPKRHAIEAEFVQRRRERRGLD